MSDEPKANVRIEKTVKDVPISSEEMEAIEEATSARPGRPPGRPSKTKFQSSSQVEDEDEFPLFLNDPAAKIFVDRVSPKEWKGTMISGQLDEFVPPTTQEEIESEIRNRFGGGRFRIRVTKNGKFVAARGFTIYGNPKITSEVEDDNDNDIEISPADFSPPPFQRPYGGIPVSPSTVNSDEINQLRVSIEKEKLKKQLEEVKGEDKPKISPEDIIAAKVAEVRKEFETKQEILNLRNEFDNRMNSVLSAINKIAETPKRPSEDETATKIKIIELENKLASLKNEISAEVKSMMTDLKGMLSSIQQTPKDDSKLMTAIIEGFTGLAKSTNEKAAAIAEAERIKTEAMLNSFKLMNDASNQIVRDQAKNMMAMMESKNKGESISEIAKAVGSIREIAEVMGMSPGGVPPEEEPKDITTRIVNIIEQALPTILAQQKQAGRELTDDELKRLIVQQAEARARQMAPAYAVQFMRQRGLIPPQPGLQTQPGLQAPPATGQQEANIHASATTAPQVQINGPAAWAPTSFAPSPQAQPNPAQAANQQTAPAAKQQAPAGNEHQNDPAFKDASDRVNDVLETIISEIRIRPRKPDWVEQAYDELPEEILDRIVRVMTPNDLFAVVQPFANQEMLATLIEYLKDEKNVTWFVNGLNDLKMAYASDEDDEDGRK